MKRLLMLTFGIVLPVLLAAPVMAAEGDPSAAPAASQSEEQAGAPADGATVGAEGTVPQAQIDLYNKREEAKKRRDEALKVRAQMTQTGQ